ncbi:MAG: ABC transporter ATP-binding protein [bacterium]|nr:ABC transporter ATP-binding protein [bacterium]MDD5354094.1 ABC transporter ATP-binding protein [bacterium]MDD5756360.1 ABC transporter ATP-binding protein [bacterium]
MDNKAIFKKLWSYVKPYYSRLLWAVACMIGVALFTTASMWILKYVIDRIFIEKNIRMLLMIVLGLPLIFLLKGICSYGQGYLMSYIGQKIVLDLRNDLFAHYHQKLSLDYFENKRTGSIISRITNDVGIIQNAVSSGLVSLVKDGLTIIGLIALMFFLHWRFALYTLIFSPFIIYVLAIFGKKLRRVSTESQQKTADIYSILIETISGIKIVKAFCSEDREINRFERENRDFFNITMRSMRVISLSPPLMEFIGVLGSTIFVWYGGTEVIRGYWTAGAFFSFVGAALSTYTPIKSFSNTNAVLQQTIAASERIFKVLATEPTVMEAPDAIALPLLQKDIVFKKVSFTYDTDDTEQVLSDIDLVVKTGEIIAIVGPSGSGKTTLVNLIPRFYDPTAGTLMMDGNDLKRVTLASLRNQIGIVTQETILFSDTVRNNIAYGSPQATDKEIVKAAKAANAHSFITAMDQGYETLIRDRGINLSGGERQRIAMARAILKDPRILILDEATSALDSESEQIVQEALDQLMMRRTTFIIAHRLSTIRKADKIVVLEKGRIVDIGKHQELLNRCGLYKKLHEIQFRD